MLEKCAGLEARATLEPLETRTLLSLPPAAIHAADPPQSTSVTQLTAVVPSAVSVVSVVAEDAQASAGNPGLFTFTRSALDKATSPVTIRYTLSGTARNGRDYQRLGGTATILAKHTWVSVAVTPIAGSFTGDSRSVILTLSPGAGYSIGTRRSAKIIIAPAANPNPNPNPTPTPDPGKLWPAAPFIAKDYRGTIYTNQFGNAILTRRSLAASAVDGYDVFFDDPGTASIQTSGATQAAFYAGPGQPTAVGNPSTAAANSQIQGPVLSKGLVYIAVRGASTATKYGMIILGAPQTYIIDIPILRRTNGGHAHTFISNPYDSDIIRFTTTRPGDWTVSLAPTDIEQGDPPRGLDPTLVVFDSNGIPVAGGFTQPIDAGGVGKVEVATLKNLPGNTSYYIRVDGAGDSVGQTNIQVQRTPMPVVSVTAKAPTASGGKAGQVVVSRSSRVGFASALRVDYTLSGTAVNGIDYRRLSGSVVIPARKLSANIDILAAPGASGLAGKTVFVTLKPRADYDLGGRSISSVTFV